jgi:hypothetical protein
MTHPDDRQGLTRRAVIGGAVAAGAASLVAPAAGLATALAGRRVFSRWVGAVAGDGPVVAAPQRFALLGVQWGSPPTAQIELRTRPAGGRWSPWVSASVQGHGPDGASRGARFGEPVWSGAADEVQLQSAHRVESVRVHFVAVAPPRATIAAAALPLASPVLDAGPGQPPIIARAAWGRGHAPPTVAPGYGTIKLAFVHHTVNPNGYSAAAVPAMLLAMYDYHRYVRGFHDIAYNFVIDAFGRIWEARAGGIDEAVIGAQAGGYNLESTGVAMLGTFMNTVPPPRAIAALQHLLAWKLSLHGVPVHGRVRVVVDPADAFYTPFAPGAHVSLPRVAGHRDGDATDCPGDALYARLPSIRPAVLQLAGTPAKVTLAAPLTTAIAASPVAVSGRLALLGGPPIAGAPVEVQERAPGGAVTVLSTTTAPDGSWSATVTLVHNALLRALHRPAPAAVSDLVWIGVAPTVTLIIDSLAPLRVSGTVSPSKSHVTLDVYAVGSGGRQRLVASKRAAVTDGAFARGLAIGKPGQYQLIARTEDDGVNLAGASVALPISV